MTLDIRFRILKHKFQIWDIRDLKSDLFRNNIQNYDDTLNNPGRADYWFNLFTQYMYLLCCMLKHPHCMCKIQKLLDSFKSVENRLSYDFCLAAPQSNITPLPPKKKQKSKKHVMLLVYKKFNKVLNKSLGFIYRHKQTRFLFENIRSSVMGKHLIIRLH